MSQTPYTDQALLQRMVAQARPYWGHLAGIFLLGLLATPLTLLMPIPLKIAVDSVIGSAPLPGYLAVLIPDGLEQSRGSLLVVAVALQVLVVLLTQLTALGNYVLSTHTGERLVLHFRTRLFRHVQRLSFSFHDTRGTSDSIYRIQYDAPSIQHILVQGLLPLASSGIMVASMLYVTMRIDWQLALVALAVVPFLFILARGYKTRMRPQYQEMKVLESSALKVVQEVLTALRVVKAFGQEESEQGRFVQHSSAGMKARVRISLAEGVFGLLVNLVTAVGTAAVLYVGVRNVLSGVLTLGELLVVIAYLAQLYGPMKTISEKTATLQTSLASAQRAVELLGEVPEVNEKPHARPVHRVTGAVEFRGVSFRYSDDLDVLHDISVTIPAGTRVGIAGRTGAGKTTLLSLLTRFYDPSDGQILIDGVDARDFRLDDLRNQFAIMLQEPVLFSTSIGENIAYGRLGASESEIVEAASAADIHAFITSLPDGYETQVGERGLRLSGGERQRISLARAFLKDAPILILDEPTSSVDVRTEASIMAAMDRLMAGRTTFMIAHRLTTLEKCDLVLVIENGRLSGVTSDSSDLRNAFTGHPAGVPLEAVDNE